MRVNNWTITKQPKPTIRKTPKSTTQGLLRLLGSRGIKLADRNEESVNPVCIIWIFAFKQKFGQIPAMCFSERPKRGIPPRTSRHVLSVFCMCAPDCGSMKFFEWFTLSCTKPSEERQSYAFQQSDTTVVPGRIHCLMISNNTSDPRLGTGTKKQFSNHAQNLQKPTAHQATYPLYLRLPNLASSISTTTPGPPKSTYCFCNQNIQTSRQKDDQSTTVGTEVPISLLITCWRGYGKFNHKQVNWQTWETDRRERANQVPVNILL